MKSIIPQNYYTVIYAKPLHPLRFAINSNRRKLILKLSSESLIRVCPTEIDLMTFIKWNLILWIIAGFYSKWIIHGLKARRTLWLASIMWIVALIWTTTKRQRATLNTNDTQKTFNGSLAGHIELNRGGRIIIKIEINRDDGKLSDILGQGYFN